MTVLVTGGRGSIARATVAGLRAAGMAVRVGGREPAALGDPDAQLVDLTRPETIAAALDGIERVLLYASPVGIDGFVAAAAAAGVEQVVVVSSAAVLEPGGNPIAERHRRVEQAIAAAGFASSFLRPGAFDGNARQFLEPILTAGVIRLPFADSGDAPVDERDIADVAVRMLVDGPGAGHDGAMPHLTGPASLTRREQVEQLAAAVQREVEIVPLSDDQARAELADRMPAFVLDSLLDLWAASQGRPGTVSADGPRITGRPGRTFSTWASEVAAPLAAGRG